MTTLALPRPRNSLLDRLRTIQFGIGARGAVGVGLATKAGGVAGNGLLNSLVAYWPLNEAAGANNALDAHTNGLTLTQVSSPGSTTGKISTARTFDGANDYFTAADNALFEIGTGSLSVSIWINRTANAATNLRIVSHGASNTTNVGYALFGSNTYCRGIIGNGTTRIQADSPAITTGTWHHIVMVVNRVSGFLTLYTNNVAGTPADISTFAGVNIDLSGLFRLGENSDISNPLKFIGALDEFGLWNKALSAQEIAALFNSGAGLAYSAFTT